MRHLFLQEQLLLIHCHKPFLQLSGILEQPKTGFCAITLIEVTRQALCAFYSDLKQALLSKQKALTQRERRILGILNYVTSLSNSLSAFMWANRLLILTYDIPSIRRSLLVLHQILLLRIREQ